MLMAATEGFDHTHFLFQCVLQQFDLEDVNFCLTYIILIMKILTKLKFEHPFLF